MVVRHGPILARKEDANFNEALKLYESKQYKKALKLVDQTLKKNSNHAESLALKGCIFHFTGNKQEAEEYIHKALNKGEKNYLVNHLAGVYYRALENYQDAAKWFKATLDNGSPNKHLWRDLSNIQVHVRDYKNLKDSKQAYLEFQPGYRANWTGTAVALHLNKNYSGAVSTLSKIEDIIKDHLQEGDRYEQSECVLYKNSIIAEGGDVEKALEVLEKDDSEIRDRLAFLEYKAKYLYILDRKKEASLVYRELLKRNPDNVNYYLALDDALDLKTKPLETRLRVYEKLQAFYPLSDPPKFLPLCFLPANSPQFHDKAKEYVLSQLKRGVPSTFVNIKHLYKDAAKRDIIAKIVLDFHDNQAPSLAPTVVVWTKFFLTQHYLYLGDFEKANKFADEAISHSPTLVELYMLKARVLKHEHKIAEASQVMEEARKLDLQDRFVNSKSTKYLLRADQVDEAIDKISLFTKLDENAVNGCKDLHLMQVNWVILESAEAYTRLYHAYAKELASLESTNKEEEESEAEVELHEKVELYRGLAIKRYQAIVNIFKLWYNDLFDFHSYCLRRGTPRDYLQSLKWSDHLGATPIYPRAIEGLVLLYLELNEQISTSAEANLGDSSKTKKNNKKQKKARAQNLKKREELIAKVESVKNESDPLGTEFLKSLYSKECNILDLAFALVKPLTEEAQDNVITWRVAYEVYLKQGKYILALQAIKNLERILNPHKTKKLRSMAERVVRLNKACREDQTTNAAIIKVVEKGISTTYPDFNESDVPGFLKLYSH